MIKLCIADDHNMLINGLKLILSVRPDICVIGTANTGVELLDFLKTDKPDLILLDISMPALNGYQTLQQLKTVCPEVKVIIISMLNDKRTVLKMLEIGAMGYLFKNTDDLNLFKAIDAVMRGNFFVNEDLEPILQEFLSSSKGCYPKEPQQLISARELDIVKLIINGHTNAEIAEILFLSIRTVDTHRKNIFHKLNINNSASLVKYAYENKVFLGL